MSTEDEDRLLRELARRVAAEDVSTFKIVLVKYGHQARILVKRELVISQHIPKQRITHLGHVASDRQNALLLRKRNDIVVVPVGVATNRPCQFYPPLGARQVTIFQVINNKIHVTHLTCNNSPFSLAPGT